MYSHILVPLDGSQAAEEVLPHVQALVEKFGARVTLLRATTSPATLIASTSAGLEPTAGPLVDPTPILDEERAAIGEYLRAIAARSQSQGMQAALAEPEGPPADAILRFATEEGVDLIAMTTHARSGLERLVLGSVSDRVARHSMCPVLLVRPSEEVQEEAHHTHNRPL